ncbi:hypothetical protein ACLMJK_002288 [Lecanora helva]
MARRISSIFSVGSSSSDQTHSTNNSSLHSSSNGPAISSGERKQSPARLAAKSTPELRAVGNIQDPQTQEVPHLTPALNPSLPSHTDGDQMMLQSPQLLSPIPIDTTSPNGSRRSSISGRRRSGGLGDDYTHTLATLLKPLPLRTSSPSATRPFSGDSTSGNIVASRPGSRPSSRLGSPHNSRPSTPTKEQNLGRRRSWLPGKSKTDVQGEEHNKCPSQAWRVTPQDRQPYDTAPLANFQKVHELWDEHGDALVYLHSREHGRGPSFRIDSTLFSSSKKLTLAAHGATHTNAHLEPGEHQRHASADRTQHVAGSGPNSPSLSQPGSSAQGSSKGSRSISDFYDIPVKKDVNLCLALPLQADLSNPISKPTAEDVETLVTIRNLFALLTGQPLVATPRQSSLFGIFMHLADVLHRYEFTNLDGSTLGEEVAGSFAKVVEDFKIGDVRFSREKTIEAIVLGERMRSSALYNEGFVHAVGKYNDISRLGSSKYALISAVTKKRLERAHLDLFARLRNIRTRLDDFDFPSLFAGFANSTTSAESKIIHFKDWKNSYMSMRRHVLNLYKHRYGAWPPKARSKKNDFEESGLNRKLLLEVYKDFSDLYDVLVDRNSHTDRTMGIPAQDSSSDSKQPRVRALRRVLDEYDRSTPPVQPPVPFDIPQLPSLSHTRRDFSALDSKKQKSESKKKLEDDEINLALMQSYNRDSVKSTPFLEAFMTFERKSAHGKSIEEIADLRDGQWLFMYAVLESLPLLVVDAPGVKWNKDVEYFLCEVPKGSAPWVQENPSQKQSWYGVAGGAGMVSLPADIVEHGVEGIYRRSHCWQVAEQWIHTRARSNSVQQQLTPPSDGLLSPTIPASEGARPSPGRRRASSVGGLEHLPLPPGVVLDGSKPAPKYALDPSKTFGTILAQTDGKDKKKK